MTTPQTSSYTTRWDTTQTEPSAPAQLGLPGIDPKPSNSKPDRSRRSLPRSRTNDAEGSASLAAPGVLSLPPVASYPSMAAIVEAIAQLESYLTELKRRRGNQLGWQESAHVRATKRPSKRDLALAIGPLDAKGRPERGAISSAAAHFKVDRRTISQWRRDDAEA